MVAGLLSLALAGLAGTRAAGYTEYVVDEDWKPAFPAGAHFFSAVAVSGDRVIVDQRSGTYEDPFIVLDRRSGKMLFSFGGRDVAKKTGHGPCGLFSSCYGSHGLSVQRADPSVGRHEDSIWAMDFFNNTVMTFSRRGELQAKVGRSGVPSADSDNFDHPADAAFRNTSAFIADGDGGSNNRIERWAAASGRPERVEWVRPATRAAPGAPNPYQNPHGICWHEASDRLLVADRDHGRIAIVHPETGEEAGTLACGALKLGTQGVPYGVRTIGDTLFVAVADSPQDGGNLFVHVVDIRGLRVHGSCTGVLQTIAFAGPDDIREPGRAVCNVPHLMGVDHETRDVYLACIGEPGSNLLRLTPRGGRPRESPAADVPRARGLPVRRAPVHV